MGFSTQTGKVTVDSTDSKNPVKVEITYRKIEMDEETDLVTLMDSLQKEGIPEETSWDGEGENRAPKGPSQTSLLADGFNRLQYILAVAKAKERFNNSPAKSESNMAKILQNVLENPDASADQKARAQKMLALLTA